jgi:hypothetical protein
MYLPKCVSDGQGSEGKVYGDARFNIQDQHVHQDPQRPVMDSSEHAAAPIEASSSTSPFPPPSDVDIPLENRTSHP